MASSPPPFLTRVRLRNYRSFEACDVTLGKLAFLVGPNGSGKSNFLDALRLVTEALRTSLAHALRERGGIEEVIRKSAEHPTGLGLRLDLQLEEQRCSYALELAAGARGDFVVRREQCKVGAAHYYDVREGKVVASSMDVVPPAMSDRLYLSNAAGLPEFRPLYDALSEMGLYSINPDVIRALQSPDKGELLARDGSNLASVIARLERTESHEVLRRVREYLGKVVPGLMEFRSKPLSSRETIEFLQVGGADDLLSFPALDMSDGTLRALAVLIALFQNGEERRLRLIGIEEPETALHPAAAHLLRDCILEASAHTQVLITSHSSELLDSPELPIDSLFAVAARRGTTAMTPLGEAMRSILRDRLFTAGELLRAGQLEPDAAHIVDPTQLELFFDEP